MKTYFNPTTETVEIEAKWSICIPPSAGEQNNSGITNDPGDPNAAPGRKVF